MICRRSIRSWRLLPHRSGFADFLLWRDRPVEAADRPHTGALHEERVGREGRGGSGEVASSASRFFLSAGATRGKRLFDCAILTMKYFFDAINMDPDGELCYWQVEHRGDIRTQHGKALIECYEAGAKFMAAG